MLPAKRKVLKYLLWALLAVLAVVWVVVMDSFNRNEPKIAELQTLARETPAYPQFIQAKSTSFSKSDRASVTITYNVPAYTISFSDVRVFYNRELTARGWSPYPMRNEPLIDLGGDREGHITFRKAKYWITVEPGSNIAEYDVTFRWEDPLF